MFCTNCGKQFPDGTKFCPECGTPAAGVQSQSQRAQSFVGEIRKCPNCGEVLESFMTNCPACGYEIRNVKAVESVRELSAKLAEIEAQKMHIPEGKNSVLKMLLGRDLENTEKKEEAQKKFDEQKKQEKANLIVNYSVPNTKEDILEFMLLASSNIEAGHDKNDVVTKAWMSKFEQVYHKAELTLGNDPKFAKIQEIYTNISSAKKRWIGPIIKEHMEFIWILIFPLLLLLMVGPSWLSHNNKEKQLEAVVKEIQICIANEDYDAAYIKAQGLYMDDTWSSESTKRWDKVRKDLIDLIETKSGVSYTSGTSSSNQEDTPTSNSSEGSSSSSSSKGTLDETKEILGESIDTVADSFKDVLFGIFE